MRFSPAGLVRVRAANTVHGMTRRGGKKAPEYLAWTNMKTRCYNQRYSLFREYGGRGITVCQRWRTSFAAFFADVGPKPSDQHYLDRINNDGNYEPGNVRWAAVEVHARNKRTVKRLTIRGETKTIPEWEAVSPVQRKVIWRRLKDGWPPEAAVFLPAQRPYARRRAGHVGLWEYRLVLP